MGCKGPSVQIRPPRPVNFIFLSSNGVTGMFCPSCGKENADEPSYCSQCGRRLQEHPTDEIRRPASARAAQGRVLAFDDEEGTGVISGDNGSRYSFIIQEWRSQSPPQPGMHVDFVSDDHEAMDIYGLSEQPSGTGTTQYSGSSATQSLGTGSKSKVAAGLFGIFLGWLGIHKFYLGYTVPGIILLVAGIIGFFLFVPAVVAAIIGIIEGILYLTKSDEEFDRVYVQEKREWF